MSLPAMKEPYSYSSRKSRLLGIQLVLHFLGQPIKKDGYVVVQFDFWFNLDFPLFFAMLIYDNEYKTKENPN